MLTAVALSLALAAALLWPRGRSAGLRGGTTAQPSARVRAAVARRGVSGGEASGRQVSGRRGTAHRRARARLEADLADFVALLVGPLRSGATPGLALVTAARSVAPGPQLRSLLDDLVEAERAATGLTSVWLEHAERLDSDDLRFVARAWQLTERAGAPLAEALAAVEQVLRARHRARERVATAASGPRASMGVLVALPCAGPLVGLAFGVGPTTLYLSSPVSLAAGVLGLVLALLGWLWARRIIAGAVRGASSAGAAGDG